MQRRNSRFIHSLTITILAIVVGLLSISGSLPQTNLVSAISAQEKGGVPSPSPKPKSRPTPRPPTSTSSGARRKITAPAKSRQTAPQIEMALMPAGTFMMGSPDGVGSNDEHPQHRVTVQSFYMGKYEVTQAQYRAVMGTNPSKFKGDDLPVENVSWNDAKEFCRKLSQITGREYRLPSEAEWECACRAGTTTEFAFGRSLSSEQANFDDNFGYGGAPNGIFRQKTTPVGSFQPNAFGLYDMHGNVWEWCEDWYHESYNGAPLDGSAWLSGGEQKYRVLRGGAWTEIRGNVSSAVRDPVLPDNRLHNHGFRLVKLARS
jgi:formylglycine-generating enzyme required for sulfatase activity